MCTCVYRKTSTVMFQQHYLQEVKIIRMSNNATEKEKRTNYWHLQHTIICDILLSHTLRQHTEPKSKLYDSTYINSNWQNYCMVLEVRVVVPQGRFSEGTVKVLCFDLGGVRLPIGAHFLKFTHLILSVCTFLCVSFTLKEKFIKITPIAIYENLIKKLTIL